MNQRLTGYHKHEGISSSLLAAKKWAGASNQAIVKDSSSCSDQEQIDDAKNSGEVYKGARQIFCE